jgi:hypothetical protein
MRVLTLFSAAALLAQAQTFEEASIRPAAPSGTMRSGAGHPGIVMNASLKGLPARSVSRK